MSEHTVKSFGEQLEALSALVAQMAGEVDMLLAQYLRGLRAALGLPGPWPWVLPLPTWVFMLSARVASVIPGSILDAETAGMLLRGNAAPVDDFQRLLGRGGHVHAVALKHR